MATWRRRELERRSATRSGALARAFRIETMLAVIALVLAGFALWQALAAQSRAELIAHDLGVATARLRLSEGAATTTPSASLTPLSGAAPAPGGPASQP